MNDKKPTVKSSKVVYKNPFYSVVEEDIVMLNGREATFYTVQKTDAAFIIAEDADGKILLVDMYRYTTKIPSLEVPAGNFEPGDSAEQTARKELQEETGHKAKKFEFIGKYAGDVGIANRYFHLFVATGLEETEENEMEEESITAVLRLSMDEVDELIASGRIVDTDSLAMIQAYRVWKSKR